MLGRHEGRVVCEKANRVFFGRQATLLDRHLLLQALKSALKAQHLWTRETFEGWYEHRKLQPQNHLLPNRITWYQTRT